MTRQHAKLLRFIYLYQAENDGISPSFREMCAAVGIKSTSGITRLLDWLESRGHLRRLFDRARAIEILRPVPVSTAPDGQPLIFVPARQHRASASASFNVCNQFHAKEVASG